MKEEQILLNRLFSVLRANSLGKRFSDIIPDEFTMEDFIEGITTITEELERKDRMAFIELSDEYHSRIKKHTIKTYRTGEDVDGSPIIVINEFMPEMASCVGERTYYYEDESVRDADIEKLRFVLS